MLRITLAQCCKSYRRPLIVSTATRMSSTQCAGLTTKSIDDLIAQLDSEFSNRSNAVYKNKSKWELIRAMTVLRLCSSNILVDNNQKLLKLSRQLLGRRLHHKLMNVSFYGQFVIGAEANPVSAIIKRYMVDGVNPILYYALEEDKSSDKTSISNDPFYAVNVDKFKAAIDITSDAATEGSGYIAVKPTALCAPNLWLRLTDVIKSRSSGHVSTDYHSLANLVEKPFCESSEMSLTTEEHVELQKLIERGDTIIDYAIERGVGVMIDAEQTYFQPAIQRILGVEMMRRFNRDKAHVLTTYQTYLKGADKNISRDMDYCRVNGIKFGARIVRGAYLDQERMIAKANGTEDPTNPTFEATSTMYHKVSDLLLEEVTNRQHDDVKLVFATHNEDSIRYLIDRFKIYKPPITSIGFGQLYGMCDHITFHLGQIGFPVYKSMPFGPIELVTSYLGRRAVENRGVLDKVKKERQLLRNEMKRRLFSIHA